MSFINDFVVTQQNLSDYPSAGDSFGSQEEEIGSKICRLSSRRRCRTNFSESQFALLEQTFSLTHYPDHQMKREIAFRLGIASDRVTVWFQNRRSKWRRSNCAVVGLSNCPTQKSQCQQNPPPNQQQNAFCDENSESLLLFSTEKERNWQNKQQKREREGQSELKMPTDFLPTRPDSAELATPNPSNCWTEQLNGMDQQQRIND